eukprot:CAMPEP_0116897140 /NCGR_PEP_ID=MMETSP0467-20121206/6218_1 /TAXON_ID=283647 /ORGANISM="Mesodinium pulex, Strain SPMC105" /LENGTH=60 /DNA_ID=CAMNT_0004568681 /DNA_START=592 /DNA_END=774 /DNA_ORIENTATION=+
MDLNPILFNISSLNEFNPENPENDEELTYKLFKNRISSLIDLKNKNSFQNDQMSFIADVN